MKNNEMIFSRLKGTLESDKVRNINSLSKLLKNEIMRVVSSYVQIDFVNTNISVEAHGAGLLVRAEIVGLGLKKNIG